MHVVLCVDADGRRSNAWDRLAQRLALQRFARSAEPVISVMVVDVSGDAAAERAADGLRQAVRWPVEHVAGPTPELARRKAVALALDRGADAVAFLGAGAAPAPHWLDELLWAQAHHGADAVEGPVVPRYSEAVPAWVRRGGFFESPRRRTGEAVPLVRPGNVLVTRELLAAATSGGPGPAPAGAGPRPRGQGPAPRVVWADRAVVEVTVEPERATARWILRRAFHERIQALPPHAIVLGEQGVPPSAARALVRMAEGGFLLSVAVFLGRAGIVHALCRLSRGAGELRAALRGGAGIRPHEPA